MNNIYQYIAVFKTALINSAPHKVVSPPVKIEYFSGDRTIVIPHQDIRIIVPPPKQDSGFQIPFLPGIKLLLNKNDGPYLSISVRTKANREEAYKAKQFCDQHIDLTISYMSFTYSPSLFAIQVYRGIELDEDEPEMNFMLLMENPVSLPDDLSDSLSSSRLELSKDKDHYSRYLLMSRFYAKSILVYPGEEKFLYLWTILEIFPMKDTSNIRAIHDYLGGYMNKDSALAKDKLGIGKLYSIRCNLVHDGRLDIPGREESETFQRLELICLQILRSLNGLPYSGALEMYFS